MLSAQKIKDQIVREKNNLFKSFLIKTPYKFDYGKIKKFKKFNSVIVIGMGGSILGAKAIYSFLRHKIKKKFTFIDNLDQDLLVKSSKENKLSKTLFLIVSKSGNTNETIINLSYFKRFLKRSNVIILSEKKDNTLFRFAKENNFTFVEHNPYIGGRYSVFSEAGMLPAYLMGLKPNNFKKNLHRFLNNKKDLNKLLKNLIKLKIHKSRVMIMFNYVPELNDFLFWSQQLFAESLGKNKKGFIPVVSSAPKDHHSLLQLYLDGPKDKIFYVFSTKKTKKLKLKSNIFKKNIKHLRNKSYQDVKSSQKNAFLATLKSNKTPFREIIINNFNEDNLSKLFLLFIFETIALGKIMGVNPYNQPAVEKVKILTKKFLSSG